MVLSAERDPITGPSVPPLSGPRSCASKRPIRAPRSGDQTSLRPRNLAVLSFLYWCAFRWTRSQPGEERVRAEFEAARAHKLCPPRALCADLQHNPRVSPGFFPAGRLRGDRAWPRPISPAGRLLVLDVVGRVKRSTNDLQTVLVRANTGGPHGPPAGCNAPPPRPLSTHAGRGHRAPPLPPLRLATEFRLFLPPHLPSPGLVGR